MLFFTVKAQTWFYIILKKKWLLYGTSCCLQYCLSHMATTDIVTNFLGFTRVRLGISSVLLKDTSKKIHWMQ